MYYIIQKTEAFQKEDAQVGTQKLIFFSEMLYSTAVVAIYCWYLDYIYIDALRKHYNNPHLF